MRALIVRGATYIPLGDADKARADFDAALAVPGAERYAHARGDAYAGRGATGTMRNDFASAANDLGQARVLLDQSGVARVDLEWALLDHARGAAEPAATRFAQAARQFEALAAMRPLKSALIGLEDAVRPVADRRGDGDQRSRVGDTRGRRRSAAAPRDGGTWTSRRATRTACRSPSTPTATPAAATPRTTAT